MYEEKKLRRRRGRLQEIAKQMSREESCALQQRVRITIKAPSTFLTRAKAAKQKR